MRNDLRGIHDVGEIINISYRVYARNFLPLILISALIMPLQLLAGVLQEAAGSDETRSAVLLLQIPIALVGGIVGAALIYAVNDGLSATAPDFGRSLDAVFERLWALVTSVVLVAALAISAGLAFPFLAVYWLFNRQATIDGRRAWWMALVPFALVIYLAIRWVFIQQVVMIDGKRNWAALEASADLVRGQWWRTFGILLLLGLIQAGPILLTTSARLLPPLASATITSLVFAIVAPFYIAGQTLLFYDLRARKQAHVSVDGVPASE